VSEPLALRYIKGIGPRRAEALASVGIEHVADLVCVFPFRWEDRRAFARVSDLRPGAGEATLDLRVVSSRLIRTRRRGLTIFTAVLADASGSIKAVWYNQPYLERVLVKDSRVVVFGRASLDRYGRELILDNPDYERLEVDDETGIHTGRIVPVYRKLGGLASRALRSIMYGVLAALQEGDLVDPVPADVRDRQGFAARLATLSAMHFPPDATSMNDLTLRRTPAQRGLAFEEIFLVQLALAERRRDVERQKRGAHYDIPDALRVKLAKLLPFKLTDAQKRVLKEIGADLRSSHPMNRLLQGDVGSGKTIVALLTLLVAVENGYQAALMAPTEILADQHARSVLKLLQEAGSDVKVVVLMGSQKAAAKRRALEDIATGRGQIVVGTHALFEGGVTFKKLGLVVVDEQHRFGVMQRFRLMKKPGEAEPDVLVMTATPIPRTLALTLYGDLDTSVLDELPPGRTPIKTTRVGDDAAEKVWEFVRKQVKEGRQAYVVYPVIDEGAMEGELKAAIKMHSQLRKRELAGLRVGLLHGRMSAEEKDATMAAFQRGTMDVLVATTVIEVGVDVPNATVMVVEHAERFGLSQLHQLRGRIGRGAAQSYCVLMTGGKVSLEAEERLQAMVRTQNGFEIAELDLQLRGPGEFFGTKQAGMPNFRVANLLRDRDVLELARKQARLVLEGPNEQVTKDEIGAAVQHLRSHWNRRYGLVEVG
jgi:ATP-dependent DNA helicase RecG